MKFKIHPIFPCVAILLAPFSLKADNVTLDEISKYTLLEDVDLTELGANKSIATIKNLNIDAVDEKLFDPGSFTTTTTLDSKVVFTLGSINCHDLCNIDNNNKLEFNYASTFNINTSFNGDDNLFVNIISGNGVPSENYGGLLSSENSESLAIQSLYYSYPVGELNFFIGPKMRADDNISAKTSIASESFRFRSMPYSGTHANYQYGMPITPYPGIGLSWFDDASGLNASVQLVSNFSTGSSGIFTDDTYDTLHYSVGYDNRNYGGGFLFSNKEGENTLGIGLYWSPTNFPDISLSYDSSRFNSNVREENLYIGLDHTIGKGKLSFAYNITSYNFGDTHDHKAYEIYYDYSINDFINIKPGLFKEIGDDDHDSSTGLLVETTFKF